jgi:DNA invertase Pin-like site-specific DNA recombinase
MPALLTTAPGEADDLFAAWLDRSTAHSRARGRHPQGADSSLRFAFYGRISTDGYQDPASSRLWQYDTAVALTTRHGRIVAEYFDVGYSRNLPWHQRPQGAELLRHASQPGRRFDAVVVGEYERAFVGRQALQIIPYLQSHGVAVWLPEIGGPVDSTDPTHRALLMLLGHQSEREVLRARLRTTRGMCIQARDQGRHLGGRPPYGYRLVDAGPHPNRIHAQWGRRLHRLDPDPVTAPHLRWIFARRLAGASTAGIARTLNERQIPSPSAYDPGRNKHRSGTAWTLRTVAEILANPRYTGRQVWNRQRTDHNETIPGDKRTSRGPTRAWNLRSEWVISTERAHPALVSDADFLAAQSITAVPVPRNGSTHRYQLTGLLICGICGRRLEGHWIHGRAGYRCRHGHTSTRPRGKRRQSLYWAERPILDDLLYALSYHGALPLLAGTDIYSATCTAETWSSSASHRRSTLRPNKPNQQLTPPQPSLEGMNLVGVNVSETNTSDTHTVVAVRELLLSA